MRLAVAYVVVEELHNKGGHTAVDTDEEVDAGQHYVSCAGHAEEEGGWVHHGSDGPSAENKTLSLSENPVNYKYELH